MPITITLTCRHCQSDQLVKYGVAPNGKQKYLCRACKKQSRENPAPNGHPPERRAEILRAAHERSSLRGLERTFGVQRETISTWVKKSRTTPIPSPNTD
jgi:transposase-like protein